MSKQTKPITKQCQHRSQCSRDAIIGVYGWRSGDTDVNLDAPIKVYCGPHKPVWSDPSQLRRNVRIVR